MKADELTPETEAVVTETEQMPAAVNKFRPRTPILEDALEDKQATPRPSVDLEKISLPTPSPARSPTPPSQPIAASSVRRSPTPSSVVEMSAIGSDGTAATSQPQKLAEPQVKPSTVPQTSDSAEGAEQQPAIKTITTDKGKSKVTGKTIGGWI